MADGLESQTYHRILRRVIFWPCRLALKIFARSRYEAILGQPPSVSLLNSGKAFQNAKRKANKFNRLKAAGFTINVVTGYAF
jgi:hypothetical protein